MCVCIILFSRRLYNISLAISADQSDSTLQTPGGCVMVWRAILRQHVSNEADADVKQEVYLAWPYGGVSH